MRALTGAVIGSAVTAVVLGGFALARYEASAGAQDAACSKSLGYVSWIPVYLQTTTAARHTPAAPSPRDSLGHRRNHGHGSAERAGN